MDVFLICKEDSGTSRYRPFGFSYDSAYGAYLGFKTEELARYLIGLGRTFDGYLPVNIRDLPPDRLDDYETVMILETEDQAHNLFQGRVKTLLKKAPTVARLLRAK